MPIEWSMVYHRMKVAEDNAKNGKPGCCDCEQCQIYMGQLGLDTDGKELTNAAGA